MTTAPARPAPTTILFDLGGTLVHTTPATAYLGDAPPDIQAPRRAGLLGIGAAHGDWGGEPLWAGGAEVLILTPLQLLDTLDSWNAGSGRG